MSTNDPSRTTEVWFAELIRRLQDGERHVAEQMLAADECLREDESAAVELICREYRLLEGLDDAPVRQEFVSRFPDYRERLEYLLGMGTAPAASDDSKTDTRGRTRLDEKPACIAETQTDYGTQFFLEGATAQPGMVGRFFGDYELLDKLGSGGMGVVYRARQQSAKRLVALKLIRAERLDALQPKKRQEWLDRFRSEAQAAARLEHDHVVTIYDVGEFQGTLYYSMQHIDGTTLAHIVSEGPLENRRAAHLIERVARAVEHAHQHGILHRDLKPQNILIRHGEQDTLAAPPDDAASVPTLPSGQTPADERPYVADFGLAKWLEEGADGATHTGDMIGTPSYMSPEQVRDASRCTAASDIYGLGATLYELLTARPPFHAVSPVETLRQVIDQDPVAPRDLNPAIDLDLETITLKALAKEPARRYATAADMADDLRRYLNHEAILARPVGVAERAVRWFRRNPALGLLGAGVVCLAVGLVVSLTVYSVREHAARKEAESYLQITLSVIDQMLVDVADESLAHVPQMQSVRKKLLEKALLLQRELLNAQPAHPERQLEFARVLHRLGLLYELFGAHEEAKSAYAEAIRYFERLRAADPGNLQVRHHLAISHTMLGEVLRKTFQEEAELRYVEALELQEELFRLDSTNSEYQRELSRTLNNLGLLLTETGRYEEAENRLSGAIEHLEELVEKPASEPDWIAELGRSKINLGVLLRAQAHRAAEAETWYQSALSDLHELVKRDPANRGYRHKLAVAHLDLGNCLLGLPEKATSCFDSTSEAHRRLAKLCEEFPGIPLYRYDLANSENSLANASLGVGDKPGVEEHLKQAQNTLKRLAEDFPPYEEQVGEFHSLRGNVSGGLGYYVFKLSEKPDAAAAQALVETAIRHQSRALKLAADPTFVERLSGNHAFLAQILEDRGMKERAEEARRKAEEYQRKARDMKKPRAETQRRKP